MLTLQFRLVRAVLCCFAASLVATVDSIQAQERGPVAQPLVRFKRSKFASAPTPAATGKQVVGYRPAQILQAYDMVSDANAGAGQTIAIIEAYGSRTATSDLAVFSNKFGLPKAKLTIAYPQGTPATQDENWALETALDLQWAHALAPAAKLLLVVTATNSYDDLLAGIDYAAQKGAKQINMSWGSEEWPGQLDFDRHFNVPGVVFTAAAGDNGYGTWYPCSSPNVTCVGGTTLNLDDQGNRLSDEMAWSLSGGGQSAFEVGEGYQTPFIGAGIRQVPDVSFLGDPVYGLAVYNTTPSQGNTGWMEIAGTSAGAPAWAAIIARANVNRSRSLDRLNRSIYQIAGKRSRSYRQSFIDITQGCNSGQNAFSSCAATSYDTVTGVGSPRVRGLLQALTAY